MSYVIQSQDGLGNCHAEERADTLEAAQEIFERLASDAKAYSVDVLDCDGDRLIFGCANGWKYEVNVHGEIEWQQ